MLVYQSLLAGLFSGIAQGRVAASGIQILAKKPEHNTKGIILSAMVETYALLGFVISFLLVSMQYLNILAIRIGEYKLCQM